MKILDELGVATFWEKIKSLVSSSVFNPDGEDLISVESSEGTNVMKLADRSYSPSNFSGKGYKILRKNIQKVSLAVTNISVNTAPSSDGYVSFIINGIETHVDLVASTDNTIDLVAQKIATKLSDTMTEYEVSQSASSVTLTRKFGGAVSTSSSFSSNSTGASCTISDSTKSEHRNIITAIMINSPNTIYEIRYDFDLNGETIEMPEECTLKFEGGSLKNGTVKGNNTNIEAKQYCIFGRGLELNESYNCVFYPEWFGAKGDGITDDTTALKKVCLQKNIKFCTHSTYLVSERITCKVDSILDGCGAKIKINFGFADNCIFYLHTEPAHLTPTSFGNFVISMTDEAGNNMMQRKLQIKVFCISGVVCKKFYDIIITCPIGLVNIDKNVWMITFENVQCNNYVKYGNCIEFTSANNCGENIRFLNCLFNTYENHIYSNLKVNASMFFINCSFDSFYTIANCGVDSLSFTNCHFETSIKDTWFKTDFANCSCFITGCYLNFGYSPSSEENVLSKGWNTYLMNCLITNADKYRAKYTNAKAINIFSDVISNLPCFVNVLKDGKLTKPKLIDFYYGKWDDKNAKATYVQNEYIEMGVNDGIYKILPDRTKQYVLKAEVFGVYDENICYGLLINKDIDENNITFFYNKHNVPKGEWTDICILYSNATFAYIGAEKGSVRLRNLRLFTI